MTVVLYPLVSFLSFWHIAPIAVALLAFSIANQVSSNVYIVIFVTSAVCLLIGLTYVFGIAKLRSDYVLLVSVLTFLCLKYVLATDYGGLRGAYGLAIPAEFRISGAFFSSVTLTCIAVATLVIATFESTYRAPIALLRCDRGLAASYGVNRKSWLIGFASISFVFVGFLEGLLILWAGSASNDLLSLNKAILPLAIIMAASTGGVARVLLFASAVYCLDTFLIYWFYYDGQLAGSARTLLESAIIVLAIRLTASGTISGRSTGPS